MTKEVDQRRGIYRKVYSGFIYGKRINSLPLEAEAWFWRVQAIADDFGNLPGKPSTVRNLTAGERDVSVAQVSDWIDMYVSVGLAERYEVDGVAYLSLVGFEDMQPAGKNGRKIRKYPGRSEGVLVNPGESEGIRGNAIPSAPPQAHAHAQTQNHAHTQSEGVSEKPTYDCWDGVKRSNIFRAYPELGRKQPAPAQDAIGNAAEWIVENRPDLGDPLAFLMDRVKAYAKSPEGLGRYVPNAAKWFQDRRFMEGERSWQRGDDKRPKKAKTYSELEAERNANGTATETH